MKGLHKFVASLAVLFLSSQASAGTIVAVHDEWAFTNKAFEAAGNSSTTNFALNVASYLKGSAGAGNYLVYSDSLGFDQNSKFTDALLSAGHNVTFVSSTSALPSLSGYDGIFVSGLQGGASSSELTNFVNSGKGVFVAAGNSYNPGMEAGRWNPFLSNFGLTFDNVYNGLQGVFSTAGSSSSLFNGVSNLYFDNGNNVNLIAGNPNSSIVMNAGGKGLIGVYNSGGGAAVPEPATLALLGSAICGAVTRRKKSRI